MQFYIQKQNDNTYILNKPPAASNDNLDRNIGNPEVVAKVYQEEYAPLLRAAPLLLEACERAIHYFGTSEKLYHQLKEAITQAKNA